MIKNIAIIGYGFVGAAVDYGFDTPNTNRIMIDPKLNTSIKDLERENIDVAFICVPTPMSKDGSIDASIVIDCVDQLLELPIPLIIIKSTITPDVISEIFNKSRASRIVYNPEFLTEKNFKKDFINPSMHIFGGDLIATSEAEKLYNNYSLCCDCPVFHMKPEEASLVKYAINCFLASKVVWFNQFYDVVKSLGCDYNNVISAVKTDPRVGASHTSVPGFDEKRGYAGSCFPKDTVAFASFADKKFTILNEVIKINQEYRAQYSLSEREIQQNIRYNISI